MRAVVVDDERLARVKLRRLLEGESVAVVEEAASAEEAVAAIRRQKPDVVFLDIHMPGSNGFDVIRRLAPSPLPPIVFVTAHDEYAVQAFEVEAVDYLLKPFDSERLRIALARIRRRHNVAELPERIERVVAAVAERREPLRRILVSSGDRARFVRVEDILCLEAADNYVRIHCSDDVPLVRGVLSTFETQLDPARFARAHRSWIVNLDAVVEVRQMFHGQYRVVLRGGRELPIGRAYRERFLASR